MTSPYPYEELPFTNPSSQPSFEKAAVLPGCSQ